VSTPVESPAVALIQSSRFGLESWTCLQTISFSRVGEVMEVLEQEDLEEEDCRQNIPVWKLR
jgi:ribulose bisphosphate carboxylase small subunit